MAEQDALSTFDFNKVTSAGLFVKFEAGRPLTLRVLTVDPVVSQQEFEDKLTKEVTLSTRFAFIVYNFIDNKAQILQTTPTIAKKIGSLHTDPDFGANIRKIDIKISPSGEKLERRYDIQVLPKPRTLTNDQIKEAQAIDLDDKIENGYRMSVYDTRPKTSDSPKTAKVEDDNDDEAVDTYNKEAAKDEVFDGDEEINLDDIPF